MVVNLGEYKWFECNWKGLTPRYEHSAFIPINENQDIVVFGGAQMDKNLNDVWVLENGKFSIFIVRVITSCSIHLCLHNVIC